MMKLLTYRGRFRQLALFIRLMTSGNRSITGSFLPSSVRLAELHRVQASYVTAVGSVGISSAQELLLLRTSIGTAAIVSALFRS